LYLAGDDYNLSHITIYPEVHCGFPSVSSGGCMDSVKSLATH